MLIAALVGLVSNLATKAAAEYVNSYTGNTFNNPVSSAMSYYIGVNHYVYTDGKEISDRQRSALYQTVSKFLAGNKDYLALSDAEKQKMYEAMAI